MAVVTTAVGQDAWLLAHPGASVSDFLAQQRAENSFAQLSNSQLTSYGFLPGPTPPGGNGGGVIPPIIGPPGIGTSGGATSPDTSQMPCGVPITWTPDPTANPKVYGSGPIVFEIPEESPNCGNTTWGDWKSVVLSAGITAAIYSIGAKIISGTPPIAQSTDTSGGSSEGPIYVSVTENSQIATNAVRAVASAVSSGIQQAANEASSLAAQTTAAVTSDLTNFAQSFSQWQDNVSQSIQNTIVGDLASFLNPLGGEINGINNEVGSIGALVNSVTQQLISPISSDVANLTSLLGGSLNTVTQDLNSLIGPFNGLVNDFSMITPFLDGVAGSISDIDKVLGKIGAIWTDVHSVVSGQIITDLHNIADTLAGVFKPLSTVYKPNIPLATTCEAASADEWLQKQLDSFSSDSVWTKWIADAIGVAFTAISAVLHYIDRYNKIYAEIDNRACPITRLDPGTVAQAASRQIISEESAREELLSQGFNQTRQDALFAMQRFLEPPAYAIESWWRGVTTDSDLAQILANNGYSQNQVDAAKELSQSQLPIPAVLQAWLRGDIDEGEVDTICKAQKYNPDQIKFFKAEALRPANLNEALLGHRTRDFLGSNILALLSNIDQIPQWFTDAGKQEGLNDDAIRQSWWASLNRLDPVTWAQLYFKGLRDLGTVRQAFVSFGIPDEFHVDYIDNLRPLIPFRSLPALVKAGYMTVQQAKDELSKHGFDSTRVDILAKSLQAASPVQGSKTATAVKGESIANATAAFNDGLITLDQYVNVLVQHGYSQELATAQAHVQQMKTELQKRKQVIVDLEAEVEAGTVTQDDAVAQLHQLGATEAEIARFNVAVRRINTQKVKHPSISDLNRFYKAKLISADQYKSELVSQGWQDPWLTAFLGLEVTPETLPTSAGVTP